MLEKLRFSSIELILLLEKELSCWVENNYHFLILKVIYTKILVGLVI